MSSTASHPSVAELVFCSEQANHNFSRVLGDLKRANLSIHNRLRSIRRDAAFVADVAASSGIPGLPLVANERCGSWYIPPDRKAASAYFKSTDGHTGQWSFSTRRLNLHLLEVVERHDGCIVVDSTRRGKSMPDALSKTVPIWCCVLNRVLFPSESFSHALFVPPRVVSDSERSQIEARVPSFVTSCKDLALDLDKLRMQIKKPLRPVWRTPDDEGEAFLAMLAHVGASGFHPVVCCTSSHRVVGAEMSEAGYVQGAGDDTENWALGLTAPVFWAHADELAQTAEADLPGLIAALVAADREADVAGRSGRLRQLAPRVAVAALPLHEETLTGTSCSVMLVPRVTEQKTWVKSKTRLEVGLGKGKVASRTLRLALPQICDFVSTFLASPGAQERQVVVACDTAKDLSIGVGLALVCWCFDDEGRPVTERPVFTKALVKVRLGRIMTAMPDANPSRATLQSVNGFLMDWRA